jgi:hypothetical protein
MSTEDFIDNIVNKDFNAAEDDFEQMMGQRIGDALDQQKIVAASHMFGELPDDEDDIDDVDPEDLEIDDDDDDDDDYDETEEEFDDDDDDDDEN